jgi:hypothetical protein
LTVRTVEFVPSAVDVAFSLRLVNPSDAVGPLGGAGVTATARLTVPEYLPEPINVIITELSIDPGLSVNADLVELIEKSPRTLTLTLAA